MKLEKWLHLKGYTTKDTAYHKIKANKGGMKALIDIFNELDKGNFLHFQELINEIITTGTSKLLTNMNLFFDTNTMVSYIDKLYTYFLRNHIKINISIVKPV